MISNLDGSLGSRYFLNVANVITRFASFIACLKCTSDLKVTYCFCRV